MSEELVGRIREHVAAHHHGVQNLSEKDAVGCLIHSFREAGPDHGWDSEDMSAGIIDLEAEVRTEVRRQRNQSS